MRPDPSTRSVTAVVPTLGRSSFLLDCLDRLRAEGGRALQIVVVHQDEPLRVDLSEADKVLSIGENLGFSGACNSALAHAEGDFVAIVNDDALVQTGWLEALTEALAADSRIASAQGLNLSLADENIIDGCGIAWNQWWRPVQIGQGLSAELPGSRNREIFGASATAVIYRRDALAEVAFADHRVFDPHLMSFYEDVELAVRLRQRGFESMVVPTARALHQGGATSRTISRESDRWRYSHRYLVLARLSGRRFWTRSILLALRDALDTGHSLLDPRGAKPVDVFRGWWRAARLVRHFIHLGRAYEGDGSFPIRVRKAASWPSMWNEDH